ncbi:hypothetical protein CPB83DRAFT_776972 [Crepidotus variabilis]|uniref:Uncharacterized protein n=1 Tax=Crepidotus variabilis TaxID=179855 RepID=A0A9P6E4R5_9AGAR|nr:hypothetical protein CPB83DRAFT_776972 [Crepidotus variabilis]
MAIRGDRFSTVQGAKASTEKGAKSQYYPLSPPENTIYNPSRKPTYDPLDLPMQTQQSYWDTIIQLEKAKTKKDETDITRKTGVSRLPLCAASPAFVHPTFFPLNPFHLFYENCMAFFWDLWTTLSHPSEVVHIPAVTARKIGTLIPPAMATLPSSFCGPVRDVFLKRNSQYKVYEWMAILHWYLVPIGIEVSLNPSMLRNFSRFVQAIEFSMTVAPRGEDDLRYLRGLIATFLEDYKRLYIGNEASKIIRARLCIFQLIHIPIHIQWYGSIRLGSQETVERTIGEMGHKIRSKKEPFSNLANLIYQRELVKILSIYYPEIIPKPPASSTTNEPKLVQQNRIAWTKVLPRSLVEDLPKLSAYLGIKLPNPDVTLSRWGKLKLTNGDVLQSRLSEERSIKSTGRRSIWLEALNSTETSSGLGNSNSEAGNANLCFGEVHPFYKAEGTSLLRTLVVFTPFTEMESMFGVVRGALAKHVQVMDVSRIQAIVGIWAGVNTGKIYILRKHPGLEYLTLDERGLDEEQVVDEDDEE